MREGNFTPVEEQVQEQLNEDLIDITREITFGNFLQSFQ